VMDSALSVRACAMAPPMAMMERVDRISSYSLRAPELDAFFDEPPRRTHGVDLPSPFERLVELIEQSPSRLNPARAGKLLQEAGFERELEEISKHAQRLGVKADPLFAIILACLLRGPLAEFLSPETHNGSMPLQEFAQRAMASIRRTGDCGFAAMFAIQDAAELNIVQTSRADEAIPVLGRLAEYLQLLAHVERFVDEQNRQLPDQQAAGILRARPAGYRDLSRIGANINWDIGPGRTGSGAGTFRSLTGLLRAQSTTRRHTLRSPRWRSAWALIPS
jgi:hypothetical protein